MTICYSTTHFVTSVTHSNQFPEDIGREVAFAGRSNSGKSSVVNAICGQKKLARISKIPGRTQAINFFQVTDERRLVDLPGYGYAKVPDSIRRQWRKLLEHYLSHRQSLRGIMLVMDIRHPLNEFDQQMLEWCSYYEFSATILLNKADKLNRGQVRHTIDAVQQRLADKSIGVYAFSATQKSGLIDAYRVLNRWLWEEEAIS